jgi:hypothetical protein
MKKLIFFAALLYTTQYSFAQLRSTDAVAYSQPMQVDSSDYFIIATLIDKTNKAKYSFSQSGIYRTMGSWTNILFYNSKTNKTKKLFSTAPIIVGGITNNYGAFPSGSMGNNMLSGIIDNNILFMVKHDEYNNDGLIDEDDPVSIFISTKSGEGLRQITPKDMHVISWQTSRDRKTIIAKMQKDKNGDKKFTDEDEIIYQIDMNDDISKIKFYPINIIPN